MTARLAKSTQIGMTWGTLSGTVGELVALLDKLLVNGSNTLSVTSITRSGAVATVTWSAAHGMSNVDPVSQNRVLIEGAGEAEYNVEALHTVVDATHTTFPVAGTPATPATGTITGRRPGCGWSIAFTGTNKRAYRAPTGLRHYLRVVDDGTTSAAYGRIRGYETMTDVDTGTGPFPTDAQISGGGWAHKSNTANATTRAFMFLGDEKRFMFEVEYDGTASFGEGLGFFFGEIITYRALDAYHTLIICANSATPLDTHNVTGVAVPGISSSGSRGHYMPRAYTQTGASVAVTKAGNPSWAQAIAQNSGMGTQNHLTYPSPIDGGLYIGRCVLLESGGIRGELPIIWCPYHQRSISNYDTWSGTGALAGKQFMCMNGSGNQDDGSFGTWCALEVSDTW